MAKKQQVVEVPANAKPLEKTATFLKNYPQTSAVMNPLWGQRFKELGIK
jgi:hypothetical protein